MDHLVTTDRCPPRVYPAGDCVVYRPGSSATRSGRPLCETELARVSLASVSARGIDKLYAALQTGTRVERRLRQANLCMIRMARAWDAVKRLNPEVVPDPNPFRGVELEHGKATAPA